MVPVRPGEMRGPLFVGCGFSPSLLLNGGDGLCYQCRSKVESGRGDSNPYDGNRRRIDSPLRLPIPSLPDRKRGQVAARSGPVSLCCALVLSLTMEIINGLDCGKHQGDVENVEKPLGPESGAFTVGEGKANKLCCA